MSGQLPTKAECCPTPDRSRNTRPLGDRDGILRTRQQPPSLRLLCVRLRRHWLTNRGTNRRGIGGLRKLLIQIQQAHSGHTKNTGQNFWVRPAAQVGRTGRDTLLSGVYRMRRKQTVPLEPALSRTESPYPCCLLLPEQHLLVRNSQPAVRRVWQRALRKIAVRPLGDITLAVASLMIPVIDTHHAT